MAAAVISPGAATLAACVTRHGAVRNARALRCARSRGALRDGAARRRTGEVWVREHSPARSPFTSHRRAGRECPERTLGAELPRARVARACCENGAARRKDSCQARVGVDPEGL